VRETTDQAVRDLVAHPFDATPAPATGPARSAAESPGGRGTPSDARSGRPTAEVAATPVDVRTTAMLGSPGDRARRDGALQEVRGLHDEVIPLLRPVDVGPGIPHKDHFVQTASWTPAQSGAVGAGGPQRQLDLQISPRLPGAEAPRIVLPRDRVAAEREIDVLYPELPPLPAEPKPLPGPEGRPYTLADFQRLAAANSPALRQAVSDVEAARGALIQAKTYPNPVVTYLVNPSNNNSTAGVQGGAVDQPIITGGKMKLGVAAAQKNLDNAILALKRARMDLATSVRNAYFALLVDVETLVVTRALAQFSDDIYRLQVGLQKGTQAAPYEPTALRAQTFTNRLAYMQAIQSYMYDWKSLVATLGLPQLPLSEIAGQVDRFIPYYNFDEVRAYVLQHHTDILTARNGVKIAQYNLKLAQVTGIIPDLDVYASLEKDFALAPFGTYQTLGLGFPLPIWNRNKGNIIAAQAALIRAGEETHRVEVTLTNNLASAYGNYRNNLFAMEYYRRNILPDLVNYYRGVYERRQLDRSASFGDLVFAQQNLSTNVNTYIGILGSLWSSVVSVADLLQTDDLYQLARPRELPGLPDFRQLQPPPHWACGHESMAAPCVDAAGPSVSGAEPEAAPAPGRSGQAGGVPVAAASAMAPPSPSSAGGAPPSPPPPRFMQGGAASLDPAAPVRSASGEEQNHEG
jgi:cobalt-zinc-cadmium efflux system outer membrane protein